MEQYHAAKRRQEEKKGTEADDVLDSGAGEVSSPTDTSSVATQTDMTAMDVSALEQDNQRRTDELAELRLSKGYPNQDDVKKFFASILASTVLLCTDGIVQVSICSHSRERSSQALSI